MRRRHGKRSVGKGGLLLDETPVIVSAFCDLAPEGHVSVSHRGRVSRRGSDTHLRTEGAQLGLTESGQSTADSAHSWARWSRSAGSAPRSVVSSCSQAAPRRGCAACGPRVRGAAPWGRGTRQAEGAFEHLYFVKLFLSRWFKSTLIRIEGRLDF